MSPAPDNLLKIVKKVRDFDTFTELLLKGALGWPIPDDVEEPDDLSFDYSAEEIGIPAQFAAKVARIRQLRPLVHNQPWGIFYVEFERKRLPVTILRRILSAFVEKRRAVSSERATWKMHDLLFVNTHGTGDHRGVTFAHFTQAESGYTAVLREFTWTEAETNLAHIGRYLDCLRWPDDTNSQKEWRERWRAAFVGSKRKSTRDAKELAEEMAAFARDVRGRVIEVLEVMRGSGSDPLRHLYETFRKVLVHDLTEESFADYYAQTMAYGLFTARFARPKSPFGLRDLRSVAESIPETNPFLRDLFKQCFGLSKKGGGRIDIEEVGLARLVELFESLAEEDIRRIMDEFGARTGDPVIHFYEGFLKAYDAKVREMRGVYYTPDPVVSYIVRSVHELLIRDFQCPLGLADTSTWAEVAARNGFAVPEGTNPAGPFVRILDPACGTGTFLKFVIKVIHDTLIAEWAKEKNLPADALHRRWNEYVDEHLLPRLYGFELLPAPYAVCHMKLGLYLKELGYEFKPGRRLNVFLTNALEPAQDFFGTDVDEFMADEANAANRAKSGVPITVVLGNPPYSGHSANNGEWIRSLIRDYFIVDGVALGEANPKYLHDDYVKFLRLAAHCTTRTGCGVLGLITNNGYLDNPTFRGMRQHVISTFDSGRIVNLHGSTKKREAAPGGLPDENVFDIQQGVAIALLIRHCSPKQSTSPSSYKHADLWGTRTHKYQVLGSVPMDRVGIEFVAIQPCSPFYILSVQDGDLAAEYSSLGPTILAAFEMTSTGVKTHRDHFAYSHTREEMLQRMAALSDMKLSDSAVRTMFDLQDTRDWNLKVARRLVQSEDHATLTSRCLYRPFDPLVYYASHSVVELPRTEIMTSLLHGKNLALAVGRQGLAVSGEDWNLVVVAQMPIDTNVFRRGGCQVFPLYVEHGDGELISGQEPQSNVRQSLLQDLACRIGGALSPERPSEN